MSRRSPGSLDGMLASGELAAAARVFSSQPELARHLGITPDAFVSWRMRRKRRGEWTPTFEELRGQETFPAQETHNSDERPLVGWNADQESLGGPETDFDDEEPTQPGIGSVTQPAVPDGHFIKGVSSFVVDGEIRGQWIKTALNDNNLEAVTEAVRRLGDGWPEYEPVPAPEHSDIDLLCVYPFGDPHIGMLAWGPETGDNFDLSIAERHLFSAVDHLVDLAPPSRRALVATVGDTLHSDGYANATTKGTRVDVDGRTPKMVTTALRTFRRVIYRALQKHQEVDVKIVPGNHDALMTLVLSIALQQFFENEPRVHIDPSPEMYQWYRFGLNLIGVTHGDKASANGMMGVMAVDRAKDWGETVHRRIYAGHIHHEVVKEVPGVIVEHLRTLASKDAWHAGMGYRSGRDMKLDVFHREDGHINRHIVGIQAIRRRAA